MAPAIKRGWINRTVLGVGLASLFCDLSHETATAVLPAFLASLGASAAALGAIEGVADAVSSFTKLGGGWLADRLQRRKPLAVFGYALTTIAMGALAFVTNAWQAGIARTLGWFGRGICTPARKALLSAAVSPECYGRAFGLERAMDETGGLLTLAYLLGAVMGLILMFVPTTIFMLAAVNGVGDFVSSIIVGLLWTHVSPVAAFGYSTVLFTAGAWIVWRLRGVAKPKPQSANLSVSV